MMFLGLQEYDTDGKKAGALEDAIGIKVIRHSKLFSALEILSFLSIFLYCGCELAFDVVMPLDK